MVFDALSMNSTCRDDPNCSWVGGQCWSGTACNAIGLAWSSNGSNWEHAEHLVVQSDPAHQCGLIRTPLGLVSEHQQCAGCYSVIYTGWGASNTATNASSLLRGHALPRGHCPVGDERCAVYQGFKPVCAALIRNTREAAAHSTGGSIPLKTDDSALPEGLTCVGHTEGPDGQPIFVWEDLRRRDGAIVFFAGDNATLLANLTKRDVDSGQEHATVDGRCCFL
jgi:hypothetical protein